MKVLKFGGSSLANGERFNQAADIVINNSNEQQTAVVLSAPAKITNYLVDIIEKTLNQQDLQENLSAIHKILTNLINELAKKYPNFKAQNIHDLIKTEHAHLINTLQGISLLNLCPDEINAKIICTGEKLSIAIMQALLIAKGRSVYVIDPVANLYAPNGKFLESNIDIAESTKRINDLNISKQDIILMAGFTAGNENNQLVVLGRNGSDYSASVLAACLSADSCEIWTDVDGVYTCDPKIVPDAKLLKTMSYHEAMELSFFGAKVMHPKTIAPIAQFHIPCFIKNTINPQAPGTAIGTNSTEPDYPIKGITHLSNMVMINISGPGLKGITGMSARIFSTIARAEISVVLITQSSSEYSISFCISEKELAKAETALNDEFALELSVGLLEPIEAKKDLAILSIVGDGMRHNKGTAAKLFAAIAAANINVIAIAQGSSERSISVVINNANAVMAIKMVHQWLFSTKKILNLFVFGTGGVGSALVNQIARQQLRLQHKNIDLRVCGLISSKHALINPNGLDLNNWQQDLQATDQKLKVTDIIDTILQNTLINPVFVDCTSSDVVVESYIELLSNGINIVTPNKKANTSSMEFYKLLRNLGKAHNAQFKYDTNVGAGLPVIENLQNLLNAGDELVSFSGILSGSLSFIFGKLEEGLSLSEATKLAKELGYTEPDPRDDLLGTDVARKLIIIAREVGYQVELDQITIEAVIPDSYQDGDVNSFMQRLPELDAEFSARINAAQQEDKVLRYIGSIDENGKCSVGIEAIDADAPLFKIKNGENALTFYTRYYQPLPLVLRGYGAGNDVTAAGVFADILRIASTH